MKTHEKRVLQNRFKVMRACYWFFAFYEAIKPKTCCSEADLSAGLVVETSSSAGIMTSRYESPIMAEESPPYDRMYGHPLQSG